MPISPNSLTMTAILPASGALSSRLTSVVLPGAQETREQGDGDALVDRAVVDAGHRRLTRRQAQARAIYSSRIAQARTGAPLPLPILIGGP